MYNWPLRVCLYPFEVGGRLWRLDHHGFLTLKSIYTLLSFWRRLWRLDHHVCVWPLRVFYTLLSFWRRLWRLGRYVYNWPFRVFYTLLSLSRRLWHLDHYVYVWPSRLFRPFCVFDIVSRFQLPFSLFAPTPTPHSRSSAHHSIIIHKSNFTRFDPSPLVGRHDWATHLRPQNLRTRREFWIEFNQPYFRAKKSSTKIWFIQHLFTKRSIWRVEMQKCLETIFFFKIEFLVDSDGRTYVKFGTVWKWYFVNN